MSESQFEQLIRKSKTLSLKREERERIERALLTYIEAHPVSPISDARPNMQRTSLGLFDSLRFAYMPVVLVLAILVSGGISYAAEGTVPGDALYPIKVAVNEEVRAWVAVGAEADAKWESRRVERRLEEVEALAVSGHVDTEVTTDIEERFSAHQDRIASKIADLEAKGNVEAAAEVSSRLETSLRAHDEVLARLTSDARSNRGLVSLRDAVRARVSTASEKRIALESHVAAQGGGKVEAAAEGKKNAATNVIAEVKTFIDNTEAKLDAEATVNANSELARAEAMFELGTDALESKNYGEAFMNFQMAERVAQSAKLLVDSRTKLNLDIAIRDLFGGDTGIMSITAMSASSSQSDTATATAKTATSTDSGNGQNGSDGEDGRDGADGKKGEDGHDGHSGTSTDVEGSIHIDIEL